MKIDWECFGICAICSPVVIAGIYMLFTLLMSNPLGFLAVCAVAFCIIAPKEIENRRKIARYDAILLSFCNRH